MKLIFLIFISMAKLFADDCNLMQEGEVVRLDAPGKSLENFKIQDQDGMGICSSNATSLLLQSVLPGNPSLSYIQIASINKREELNQKRIDQTKAKSQHFDVYAKLIKAETETTKEQWQLGIDTGNVCDTFAAIKAYQKTFPTEGICPSEYVNLERMIGSNDKGLAQQKSILSVSQYMNEFQQKFGDANIVKTRDSNKYSDEQIEENEQVIKKYQDFKLAFEGLLKNKNIIYAEDCKKINSDMLIPFLTSLSTSFLAHDYCFEANGNEFHPMCKLLKNIITVKTLSSGELEPSYNQIFLNNLISSFSKSSQKISKEFIKDKIYEAMLSANQVQLKDTLVPKVKKMIEAIRPEILDTSAKDMNDLNSTGFSKACIELKTMKYLASNSFQQDGKNNPILCKAPGIVNSVRDVVTTTAFQGLTDAGKVQDFLLGNANLNFHQAMSRLFAYDCSSAKKIRIPESFSCEVTKINSTPITSINKKIITELKENRALTARICASIIQKPKSKFGPNECGSHFISITGVKCEKGHLKYLMQNSWGKNDEAKNPAFTTDLSGNGSYWFDELSLKDGLLEMQNIRK